MGYEPILAADGAEALRKADEAPPDLVLLDIQMPVMDGFEVLHELRKNPRFMRLPIFAMTAYAMRGDQEKILAAGFDGNFSKPVNVSLLRSEFRKSSKPNLINNCGGKLHSIADSGTRYPPPDLFAFLY